MPYGSNNLCSATILSRSPVSWNKSISLSSRNNLKILKDRLYLFDDLIISFIYAAEVAKVGNISKKITKYIRKKNEIKFP